MSVHEILFATDFSDLAEAAGRVAREYARRFDARVHLFHALWSGEPVVAGQLARARDAFDGVPIVVASASGDPAEAIVRYASAHDIDLIVLGTHGRTGLSRALLGSVAERVIRTAPCPVLAVPAGQEAPVAPAPEPGESPGRCLVCAHASRDLICEWCRAKIRGEALQHKQGEERGGRR